MKNKYYKFFLIVISIFLFTQSCSRKFPKYCNNIPIENSQGNSGPHSFPVGENKYGGPYKFSADNKYQKVSNFGVYHIYDLDHSISSPLTKKLFFESVSWYCRNQSKFIYGEKYQRYNYVVNSKDEVWVATWNMDIGFKALQKSKFCANSIINQFRGIPKKNIMVNFYPEETDLSNDIPSIQNKLENGYIPYSPCRIITPPIKTNVSDFPGFLDGMSKHFLIAQYASQSSYRGIKNYNPTEWTNTNVHYAGEIIVDVENCQYFVNNWSGTYKPDPPGNYLPDIGILFTKTLGYKPASIMTYDGTEILFENDTDLTNYRDVFCENN